MNTFRAVLGEVIFAVLPYAMFAAVVLSVIAYGQNTVEITLDSGAVVHLSEGDTKQIGRITYILTRADLIVHNAGAPDNFSITPGFKGEPFFFRDVKATLPGRWVFPAPLNGAQNLQTASGNDWLLVDAAAPKHAYSAYYVTRSGAQYAPSTLFHMLDGGDTLHFHFPPRDDPYDTALLPTESQKAVARRVLNIDRERLSKWPFLQAALETYKFSAQSFNPTVPANLRDMGWRMLPDNFASRYTSVPKWFVSGHYGFGDTHSAGEGFSNEHYNHTAHWFARYLETGDPISFLVGLYKVRLQVAYGLVDTDLPRSTCFYAGMWRGEKGDRRGLALRPEQNKQFDVGLVVASVLAPWDPMVKTGMRVRTAAHINSAPSWDKAGGARGIGHTLENLEAFTVATGDARFVTRAQKEIDNAFAKNKHPDGTPALWFINVYSPTMNSAGEEPYCHGYMSRWMHEYGVGLAHKDHLVKMIRFLFENGGRWVDPEHTKFEVAYQMRVPANPAQNTYTTPLQGMFWVHMRAAVKDWAPDLLPQLDAVERAAFTHILPPFGADYPPMGPSWEKWLGMAVGSIGN